MLLIDIYLLLTGIHPTSKVTCSSWALHLSLLLLSAAFLPGVYLCPPQAFGLALTSSLGSTSGCSAAPRHFVPLGYSWMQPSSLGLHSLYPSRPLVSLSPSLGSTPVWPAPLGYFTSFSYSQAQPSCHPQVFLGLWTLYWGLTPPPSLSPFQNL